MRGLEDRPPLLVFSEVLDLIEHLDGRARQAIRARDAGHDAVQLNVGVPSGGVTRLQTPASASDLSLGAQEDAERGRFAVGMRAKVGVAARLNPQPWSIERQQRALAGRRFRRLGGPRP